MILSKSFAQGSFPILLNGQEEVKRAGAKPRIDIGGSIEILGYAGRVPYGGDFSGGRGTVRVEATYNNSQSELGQIKAKASARGDWDTYD